MSRPSLDRRAAEFERLRPYLLRVAYAHTGSISDADTSSVRARAAAPA